MTESRVFASPLARRKAEEAGIRLVDIAGSGPEGRIIAADIKSAASGSYQAPVDDTPYEDVRLSAMRKTIARRMTESKTTIPHFYLNVDIEIDELLEMRRALNAKPGAYKVSVNDLIIRAAALALAEVPAANVQFAGDHLRQYAQADVSVAVAVKGGLVTPIVRDAGNKDVEKIAREMTDLAARAREGALEPHEYQGGTIGISNLGMYGVQSFAAVINPPQSSILAVGAGDKRPWIRDGNIESATVMTVTMACDHRAMDGAIGAEYLVALRGLLEDPLRLIS